MEAPSVLQEIFLAPDSTTLRKPRADAERNREKLLDAARAAFAAQGAGVSLEEVARSAGVGIGTLYRHFPNRDALLLEVYRNEMSRLCQEAEQLAASKPPIEALRAWLLLFVDHLGDKIALGEAVKASAGEAKADVTDQLMRALHILVEKPVAEGKIADPGIEPLDLLRALYGVATATPGPNWVEAARRMVDILVAGLER
jgi:AcrR family transcriptional regulator